MVVFLYIEDDISLLLPEYDVRDYSCSHGIEFIIIHQSHINVIDRQHEFQHRHKIYITHNILLALHKCVTCNVSCRECHSY